MALTTEQRQRLSQAGYSDAKITAYERKLAGNKAIAAPATPSVMDRLRGAASKVSEFLRPTQTTEEIQQDRLQTITPETAMKEKTAQAVENGAVPLSNDPMDFYNNNEKYFGVQIGELGNVGKNAAKKLVQQAADSAPAQAIKETAGAAANAAKNAVSGDTAEAAKRMASEVVERGPRIASRVRETIADAADRNRRIKAASPAEQEAYKVDLDERFINTVKQADEPTLAAYQEMSDIAEKATGRTGGTLSLQERPEIVAGRAAEQQYDLIELQRKRIGSAMGQAFDRLSKDATVSLEEPLRAVRQVLNSNGISIDAEGALNFAGSRFTPAERNRIKELYSLAIEGGISQTPRKIFGKDQLFSKLQREARFEGIGDIIVDTPNGNSSLFRVFRDVYSDALDQVSPDDLRALKRQYRDVATLLEDIEGSIFKSGNFETGKNVEGAEFAKTNLRRLLGDAQSTAIYQAIVKRMDQEARKLGYDGANPEALITFATALRDVYKEATPQASLTGIMGGIQKAVEKAFQIGAATDVDRQKALRELLGEKAGSRKQ